jgi:hypothetical protein
MSCPGQQLSKKNYNYPHHPELTMQSTIKAETMSCSLSTLQPHTRQSRKRRVSFSRDVMVRPYDAGRCAKNKDDLWYTSDEIRQQRLNDMKIVERIREGAASSSMSVEAMVKVVHLLSEQASWNIRGLEAWLDNGEQKAQNKLRAVLAVLLEQDRQDMEGSGNDANISRRYKRVSKKCQEEAQRRAIMDQVAATAETCPAVEGPTSVCGRLPYRPVKLSKVVSPLVQAVSPRAA